MTLVVNMIAGPGAGKSTVAAGVFAELKMRGVNCELVTEYAKDLVWGRTTTTLDNQLYIFSKQHHRLWRLLGQVDVIVTDCPLILSAYYGERESDAFRRLVVETFGSLDNLNVLLTRVKPFNPAGRVQTEEKARVIDERLVELLTEHDVPYVRVTADRSALKTVADLVIVRSGRPA